MLYIINERGANSPFKLWLECEVNLDKVEVYLDCDSYTFELFLFTHCLPHLHNIIITH